MASYLLSESTVEWAKIGDIRKAHFIGKDVFAYGSGCYLIFINLVKYEETIYEANNADMGEGVECFTGHKTLSVFAFAEKCPKPRIFILKYPQFTPIHIIFDPCIDSIMTMCFSEEFLFTLESYPSYMLRIWYWRTGKQLDCVDTNLIFCEQTLRCNFGSPTSLAQLAVGTKKLLLWEITMCGKKSIILKHTILIDEKVLPLKEIIFSPEGGLFAMDMQSNIYMVNTENELDMVIKREAGFALSQRSIRENPPDFFWFKGGILLASTQGDIQHYVKKGNWSVDWTVNNTQDVSLKRLYGSYPKDFMVGVTKNGDLMLFDNEKLEFTYMKSQESFFNDIFRINPVGEYFATLAHQMCVCVWHISTGKLTTCLNCLNVVHAFGSNPVYPYLALGYADGYLELRNVIDPLEIKHLAGFRLTSNPLSSIYFHESGRLLVTVDKVDKHFFVIEGIPGSKMQVIAHVEFERTILDYILVPSANCLRLYVLFISSENPDSANVITRYCLVKGVSEVDVKDYNIDPQRSYVKLFTSMKFRKDRFILALPLQSKMVHELETKRGDPTAKLTEVVNTAHQMCNINFFVDVERTLSFSYDGFIMVRSKDLQEISHIVMVHHRNDGGVEKAIIDSSGKFIVSLGQDNTLVCTSLEEVLYNETTLKERRLVLQSPKFVEMFTNETIGFQLAGDYSTCNWLDYQKILQRNREALKCRQERQSILNLFHWMQARVEELLTKNIEGPENELLPVQDFELNVELKAAKKKQNVAESEELRTHFLNLIEAQDTVINWIKSQCWDNNAVQAQWLFGILSEVQVNNYVLLHSDALVMQTCLVLEEQRRIEQILSYKDIFEPWCAKAIGNLENQHTHRPTIKSSYDRLRSAMDLRVEIISEDSSRSETLDMANSVTDIALYGTTTASFITPSFGRYKQQQLQTFAQFVSEALLSARDTLMLRESFNTRFEALVAEKKYEMNQVKERNDKLRHIISELNYFAAEKMYIAIDDPEWRMLENPENIIKVDPSEVSVTPYISPSEQDILDKKAAEAERLRLLLLADDFRERALMAMMNGVLEIRWEDELRKEVVKPKVMLSDKDPEDYDESDLKAIKAYAEAVNFLDSERRRYLTILEEDYAKVGNSQREAIKKFNSRVAAVHLEKLRVESAIKMEELKLARQEYYSNRRCKWFNMEKELLQRIHATEELVTVLLNHQQNAGDFMLESKSYMDALILKDKQLEKIFKKDFNDYSQLVFEQCLKLYKKRPKYTTRGITSTIVLHELAKCIITGERTLIVTLSHDAMEYLKSIDHLDLYVGIVPMVDEHVYGQVCRYRRLKLESEVRLRAGSLDVSEGELTISTITKHLQRKRELIAKLQQELHDLRKLKIQTMLNMEQQICIKRGLVELPTTGTISDFSDAILICRSVVEKINGIIMAAGDRKIRAMEKAMTFRRDILKREWEHKFYQMEIDFYKTQLKIIESVKVTKEVQVFLKFRSRGLSEQQRTFEEEVEQIKASFEKVVSQSKAKVADLDSKIVAKKKEMAKVDKKIFHMNIDVCEFNLERDLELEQLEETMHKTNMANLWKRSKLVKQIQEQHREILMLKTELELLRLKTYPTLKYSLC